MTSEFDDAIRSATAEIIASTPPGGDPPAIGDGAGSGRSRVRVVLALGCLLIVAAGVVAMAVLSGTDSDSVGDGAVLDQGILPAMPLASTPTDTGFIIGRLAMEGGPEPGTIIPISGTVSIRREGIGEVLSIAVDESGVFIAQVPPGAYRISANSPSYNDGQRTCNTAESTVVVTADQRIDIDVTCIMR